MVHVVIIGAYGSAGVAVARELLSQDLEDLELTLIDDGDPGGGLCILRGCMPSKEVLSAGAHRYQARHDKRVEGIPEVDLEKVVEIKDEHTLGFAEHRREGVHEIAERENVEFIHDTAEFVDDNTVKVGDRRIDADYVVIATGSSLNVPDLPGIENIDYMSSADVLDSTEFGDTGVVMGFGYVGLELVPYLSEAAGMELTVIEHDDAPIDDVDIEFGERLLEIYEEEFNVNIVTNAYEKSVENVEDGVRLYIEQDDAVRSIDADQLFLFTGRKPNLDGLGLENTSLEPEKGWVRDTMEARDNDNVYVVGDANGKEPILHIAKEQGFKAGENIAESIRGEEVEEYEYIPHHVIFSGLGVYPFARLGMTESEAREDEEDYIVVESEASSDGVFKTKDVPLGFAKLVVSEDGTVVGYQGLHYHADVMAKTMQVIIENEMDVREIPDRSYHPTTPEILDSLFRDAKNELGS